ncbi:MAG: isopentenyl phosphate kinase [Candidatus Brocadiia bacterium]
MKDSGSPSLVFLKLGGSLLGDKRRRRAFRRAAVERLAGEIARALERRPQMRLLLAHGGGGFAHFPAKRHRTREGLAGGGGWRGFAETRRGVLEMNARVLDALARGGLRPTLVSPSAELIARDGKVRCWDLRVIRALLKGGQVPLIHGDAVLDERRGFTILSTEELFDFLAGRLHPERIILACDVEGVYLAAPRRLSPAPPAVHERAADCVRCVDRKNIARIRRALRAAVPPRADRPDVTGGMLGKVERLYKIARRIRGVDARIVSGLVAGTVESALCGGETGTAVR